MFTVGERSHPMFCSCSAFTRLRYARWASLCSLSIGRCPQEVLEVSLNCSAGLALAGRCRISTENKVREAFRPHGAASVAPSALARVQAIGLR